MTTISSIARSQPATAYSALSGSRAGVSIAAAQSPSAIVRLSPEGLAAAAADAGRARASSAAGPFKDIGGALLEQFGTGAVAPVGGAEIPGQADKRFTLSIQTESGKRVDLVLASKGSELTVRFDADEDLSVEEREAVAGLAKGFQDAIDGMTRDEPQIRLDGLAQFDTRLLRSIDLHADVALSGPNAGTQKLDVHLDASQRKVAIDGPSGKVEVAVDASKLETLDTRKQAKAIDHYLTQFDEAAARGHADPKLMQMFKDSFASMAGTAAGDASDDTAGTPGRRNVFSRDDLALTTGLPDFSASVTQARQWSNPDRGDEADGFQYEVSQETRVGGDARANRSLQQTQQSHLTAQFHDAVKDDGQSYNYHRIDDSASVVLQLEYKDGQLRKLTLEQSVSQSESIRNVVLGKQLSERTVPEHGHLLRDLLASPGISDEDLYLPASRLDLAARQR
jgi:hypothetical protein